MSGILAVAARELKEKWAVLVAALAAGLVALVVPLLSSLGRHNARDARELAAVIFAAAFAFGTAAVFGAGMINRELVERRHGFFFSRPLPAGAIWGGKVLACWLLSVGAAVVVLLPAAAISRGVHLLGSLSPLEDAAATVGVAAVGVLALVLFSHAFALMVRSHAPLLLALDAVCGVCVVTTVALALRSLFVDYALDALARAAAGVAVAALLAPLAAGFAQVSVGRTDIRRGHRVLSATLWGILGVAALVVAGYARWVKAVDVTDLTRLDTVLCAPRGEWAFVCGQARGRGDYSPWFLVNTASGRAVRIAAAGPWWPAPEFSADGTRAVWLSSPASVPVTTRDMVTLDLTDPNSAPVTTPITFSPHGPDALSLSPDGRRLALRDQKAISILELLTGRLLAAVRLPDDLGREKLLWPNSDSLVVAAWQATEANQDTADVRVFEIDVSHRTLTETGRIADVERLGFFSIVFSATTGRVVTRTGPRSNASLVLCEARTGTRIATLATCVGFSGCGATVLSDGTIAVGEAAESGVRLRLFSAAGALQRTIEVGPGEAVHLGGQPATGTLAITTITQAQGSSKGDRTTAVVDVVTGTVTPLGRGYLPVALAWWLGTNTPSAPGSAAARIFIDPDGHLVVLDPATRTFRTVLQARWRAE